MFSLICVTLGIQSTNVLPIVTSSQLVAEAFEFTQKTARSSAKARQRWPGSTSRRFGPDLDMGVFNLNR